MLLSTLFPNITPRTYPIEGETHKWDSLFGIELELENVSAPGDEPWEICPTGWSLHEDASLRNGSEFVTDRPYGADRLEQAIEDFYDKNLNFTSGPRTSTHIHVNMADATVEELRTMVAVVYTIEDAIYACTEEARKWGGYSVALTEMRPQRLRNILNAPTMGVFVSNVMPSRNNERYYGFNCNVSRHGTAEFRYFPGGPTQDELISWVDLVALIKRASKKFTILSLNNLIGNPHDLGTFLLQNFGEWANKLIAARSLSDMYSAFETVMAMALDEENLERSGGVVHITPSLMQYVETTLLNKHEEAIDQLRSSLPRSMILGENDWLYYINKAQQTAGNKKSSARLFVSDTYYNEESNDYDLSREEQEEMEAVHEQRNTFQTLVDTAITAHVPFGANYATPSPSRVSPAVAPPPAIDSRYSETVQAYIREFQATQSGRLSPRTSATDELTIYSDLWNVAQTDTTPE